MSTFLSQAVPRVPRTCIASRVLRAGGSCNLLRFQAQASTGVTSRTAPSSSRALHQSLSRANASVKRGESNNLLPEFGLKGRTIVVSGGARGLGLTQAQAVMEAGANVHVVDILPPPT